MILKGKALMKDGFKFKFTYHNFSITHMLREITLCNFWEHAINHGVAISQNVQSLLVLIKPVVSSAF